MASILLTTLNARYIHTAFGLRYLFANLGELQSEACILEFTINERAHEIVERIIEHSPRIVGFGVYIWNVEQIRQVLSILKKVAPEIVVVVGGPEVSYETEKSVLFDLTDYVITGEADLEFARFCRAVIKGERPSKKILHAPVPDPADLVMPYEWYSAEDAAHRVLYVEASRGCPFTCEFCLSSLDIPVRQFNLDAFLAQMEGLYQRGVRQFKFVDRTFNLNLRTSRAILEFFLERYEPGLFVHFEMVPDRLPDALREIIARFPPGALQFEIGIQTFNPEVAKNISRRQDYDKAADNIRYLRNSTGVHLHVDLIAGLPGESLENFSEGFDRLVALNPQEIQVGILKRLRGTPIVRHDAEWGMVYASLPPYELLQNRLLDYRTMQRLGRFARYWDLTANSGNFSESLPYIWPGCTSAFAGFMEWSEWLYRTTAERHGFSVRRLSESLFRFLTEVRGADPALIAQPLLRDYQRLGARDIPACLKPFAARAAAADRAAAPITQARQRRHLAAAIES